MALVMIYLTLDLPAFQFTDSKSVSSFSFIFTRNF